MKAESAKSTMRVAVAKAAAESLITGIDNANEEGHPLTQVQQIDMATMAFLACADVIREAEANIDIEQLILLDIERAHS